MPEVYMNQFLFVDLSSRTSASVPVPDWLKLDFVGGKGFGAKLLYDLCPANADPLGPDNPLMFMTGPLTSTSAPSMRACVVTKSPATNLFLDSYFGGRFGPEIKYAGYDGIIIMGQATEPVYLWVTDKKVEFRSADKIWGQDAIESNHAIKADLNQFQARVVTIGQAGEKQGKLSMITCEYNRQAGRGGAGAVMGSKNLKGIAVKGHAVVRVSDPDKFKEACATAFQEIKESPACAELTEFGTSSAVAYSEDMGTLPNRNYLDQTFVGADKIGEKAQQQHLFLGKAACFGCPIRCSQMGAVRTGKHAHFITDTVEYETAAMLGANLDISDVRALARLNRMCDEYGLDTISIGSVVAFAFEAIEKGVLEPPPDVDLTFGSIAGAQYLIKEIALQDSPLGKLLALGVRGASREIGMESTDYAIQVKGLELPGFAPRGSPGMGLAYMTADRGACHQRGFMVGYELGGEPFNGEPVDPDALEGKAEMLRQLQDYLAGTDALVKCDFGAMGVTPETYGQLYTAATGQEAGSDFFSSLGERIWNQTRLFNLREGMTYEDEQLPNRLLKEVVPTGPQKGKVLSKPDMDFLRDDYYRVRGWDDKGRPLPQTTEGLGLTSENKFKLPSTKK